jgi:hypothetical protein
MVCGENENVRSGELTIKPPAGKTPHWWFLFLTVRLGTPILRILRIIMESRIKKVADRPLKIR